MLRTSFWESVVFRDQRPTKSCGRDRGDPELVTRNSRLASPRFAIDRPPAQTRRGPFRFGADHPWSSLEPTTWCLRLRSRETGCVDRGHIPDISPEQALVPIINALFVIVRQCLERRTNCYSMSRITFLHPIHAFVRTNPLSPDARRQNVETAHSRQSAHPPRPKGRNRYKVARFPGRTNCIQESTPVQVR